MSECYKFWNPKSGPVGGLIFGLLIISPFIFFISAVDPHDLKVGDCYEWVPDENPFESRGEVYKCILDMKGGYVQYNNITKDSDGGWRCSIRSEEDSWFNSSLYAKSVRTNKEFCE